MNEATKKEETVVSNLAAMITGNVWRRPLRWLAFLRHPSQLRPHRQLRLRESLALGERRFLSVVEVGDHKFLVGGTGTSLALLAVLSGPPLTEGKPPGEDVAVWEFVNGELTQKARGR